MFIGFLIFLNLLKLILNYNHTIEYSVFINWLTIQFVF